MIEIDETLDAILTKRAAIHPDKAFVRTGDAVRTYSEANERIAALAAGLHARGIERGDRVVYICSTRVEMVEFMFAVWRVGAINVPLNIFLRGKSLAYQLSDCEPRIVIADAHGIEALRECGEYPASIETVVAIDGDAVPQGADSGFAVAHLEDFVVTDESLAAQETLAQLSDCASILYTSGTTGAPKGCVIGHRYVRHWGHAFESFVQPKVDPVIYTSAPLYHVMGNLALSLAIEHGGTIVFDPQFSASNFYRRVREIGATMAFGIGWLAKALLGQSESPDDKAHQLRTIYMGPVSEADRARFLDRFGVTVHSEILGQTECVPVSLNPPGTSGGEGSLGRPSDCVEVQLLDDEGFAVDTGEVGEIAIRPKHPGAMFDGYWRDSEKTLETFSGLWHHTGDLGRFDESGNLFYIDRKKDSMRRRGENVSAFEVEGAIAAHPMVAEVAVHGVRIEGEVDDAIKACLVLKPGHELVLDEFVKFVADQLPYFAVPRFVEVLTELPKNTTGRIVKEPLRSRAVTPETLDLEVLGHGVRPAARRGATAAQ